MELHSDGLFDEMAGEYDFAHGLGSALIAPNKPVVLWNADTTTDLSPFLQVGCVCVCVFVCVCVCRRGVCAHRTEQTCCPVYSGNDNERDMSVGPPAHWRLAS